MGRRPANGNVVQQERISHLDQFHDGGTVIADSQIIFRDVPWSDLVEDVNARFGKEEMGESESVQCLADMGYAVGVGKLGKNTAGTTATRILYEVISSNGVCSMRMAP